MRRRDLDKASSSGMTLEWMYGLWADQIRPSWVINVHLMRCLHHNPTVLAPATRLTLQQNGERYPDVLSKTPHAFAPSLHEAVDAFA
jgi:hypothetical protein